MADLETIVQRFEADTARFDTAIDGVQRELRETGQISDKSSRAVATGWQGAGASVGRSSGQVVAGTTAMSRGFQGVTSAAGVAVRALGALGVVISAASVVQAVSTTIAYASALDKAADAAGIGSEALQQWRFAGEQSGVTVDQMDAGISRLTQRIGQFAATGGGSGKLAFEQLGLAARIASGELRGSEDVLEAVFEALAAIPDAATRAALASSAFGEEIGPRLAALAGEGHAAVQQLIDQAPVLSDAQTQAAREIDRAWAEMTANVGTYIKGLILDFAGMAVLAEGMFDEVALSGELESARASLRELTEEFGATSTEASVAANEVERLEAAMAGLTRSRQRLLGFEPMEVPITSAAGFEPPGPAAGGGLAPSFMPRPSPSRAQGQDFGLDVVSTHGPGTAEDYATSLEALRQMSQEQAKLNKELGLTPPAVQEVNVAYNLALDTARQFASITASGLTDAIFAGQGFKETMEQIGIQIAKAATQALIFNALMGAFGGFGGVGAAGGAGAGGGIIGALFGSPRQHGGPVDPGRVYAVGERGPELFRPSTPGAIISNSQLGAAMAAPVAGGGGSSLNFKVEVNDYRTKSLSEKRLSGNSVL